MKGIDLFNLLVEATGLSQLGMRDELMDLMKSHGTKTEDLNINTVREILVDYLQDNLPNIKNKVS